MRWYNSCWVAGYLRKATPLSTCNQRARGVCVEAQHLVGMIREKVLNSLRHVMPVVVWWVGWSNRISTASVSQTSY